MTWLKRFAFAALFAVTLVAAASAQAIPALSISPGKATMVPGQTRTFRAVGKDGRMRHNVRWSISPEHAAKLTMDGDEAVVQAEEAATVMLTAYAEGDSAQATVDILSGHTPPTGTVLWSVHSLPGCTSKKMTQAVPSATGPDIYDEEECPQGNFVRALTADGRELWRRQITGSGGVLASGPVAKPQTDTGRHMNLHPSSVCDGVSPGMTKDAVSQVANAHKLHVDPKQRQGDSWDFEEEGSSCTISFDGNSGAVVRKRKTIIIE
jgi:hypothetical protein